MDSKFDYHKYTQNNIDVEQLDLIARSIFQEKPGWIGLILAGIKMIIAIGYILAIKSLVDHERLLKRQEYEQNNLKKIVNEIKQDNLD